MMDIVFFTHPSFLNSQSMPRYAKWLADGMQTRGHKVSFLTAKAFFSKLPAPFLLKKWLGYIDQYLIFPITAKIKIRHYNRNTLFVFTDHALGPWVFLVAKRPHMIHCHDFLAQRSATEQIIENKAGCTGKLYQSFIRQGYRKGSNFISISQQTKIDLDRFLKKKPLLSEVVYNGLIRNVLSCGNSEARFWLEKKINIALADGFLLHVGGNQWYKNREGVLEIYNSWRDISSLSLPLLMLGAKPSPALQELFIKSRYKKDIHFISNADDIFVNNAYRGALALIYPSLDEGFGWPIIEAMASECLVLTTDKAPMTEVAGGAAFLVKRKPISCQDKSDWALESAKMLSDMLNLSDSEREEYIKKGLNNIKRFDPEVALDKIESLYKQIV